MSRLVSHRRELRPNQSLKLTELNEREIHG